MEISNEQFAQIQAYLPRQRGNVVHDNLVVINAILWLAENDCKWSALPRRFGSWHTIYTRVNRWAKAGILDRIFEQMQRLQLLRIRLEVGVPEAAASADSLTTRGPAMKGQRLVSADLTSELPKFAWVPRIRVCHRRLEAMAKLRRRQAGVMAAALRAERQSSSYG